VIHFYAHFPLTPTSTLNLTYITSEIRCVSMFVILNT